MSKLDRTNILWESSRMFLPEHREAILKQRKEATRFVPPELDEQVLEEMSYTLQEALELEQPVLVAYASEYEALQFCGFIDKIDSQEKCIQLSNGSIRKKVSFPNLINVEIP